MSDDECEYIRWGTTFVRVGDISDHEWYAQVAECIELQSATEPRLQPVIIIA